MTIPIRNLYYLFCYAWRRFPPGGAVEICRILGKDETLRRIHVALEKLA